jgi:hypothetical protein
MHQRPRVKLPRFASSRSLAGLAAIAALIGACSSPPPPVARYASSSRAVRAARDAGAAGVPAAAKHLALAEDQLARARRLIDDGQPQEAAWLLARAQSDADLAVGLAREAHAEAAAVATAKRVRQLADAMSRAGEQRPPGGAAR